MKSRRQDFVLGIAVLMFIALLMGTVLFIYPSLSGETKQITVRFRHELGVAPLKPGSAVMLSGALQVGKVTEVRMERGPITGAAGPEEDLLIVIDADVDATLELHDDCRVTSDQPPVGGGGVLLILNVGSPTAPLATAPIDGLPPQSLTAAIGALNRRLLGPNGMVDKLDRMLDAEAAGSLAGKIARSLDDVNAMTAELRAQLSPAEQQTLFAKIHMIVDNVNEATASLRSQVAVDGDSTLLSKVHVALDQLETGLSETNAILKENRPALRNTLASIESMSQQIDGELLASLKAEFDRDDPASLLGKIHASMDHLNTSLENVEVMSDTGRKLIVLNRPLLDRTIQNLKEASDRANALLLEVLLHPWRLMKPPAGELQKHDAFVAAQFFADAAVQLNDAAARLQAFEEASSSEGDFRGAREEVEAIQKTLQATFERFRDAESYLWRQME